jgi:AcrR family transcriptional regulator
MAADDHGGGKVGEGRRERKRRQTKERIEQAAIRLFLDHGFDRTTIENITQAADVSRRSFFDYFPSKEEVVFAWQDSFAEKLVEAIAARPAQEPLAKVVEEALISTTAVALDARSMALGDLVRDTPVLAARNQLKYSRLEQKLTEALMARADGDDIEVLRIRLLSAVVVGALRVGGEAWQERQPQGSIEVFARDIFRELWRILSAFGAEAQSPPQK